MFIGTLEARKNLTRILRSFLKFRQTHSDFKLVLIGNWGYGAESFKSLIDENPSAFQRPGFLPTWQIQELFKNAQALFFPSLYEGFGIPILEAMKAGCPVITSDRGAMKEVAGSAAALVDPEDENALVDSLERLASNSSLRSQLCASGIERAKHFSWSKTAEATLAAYKLLS
jgi:glycosyltransferase involved in cell wall biosynthesis